MKKPILNLFLMKEKNTNIKTYSSSKPHDLQCKLQGKRPRIKSSKTVYSTPNLKIK
jgi:hypothetical protein